MPCCALRRRAIAKVMPSLNNAQPNQTKQSPTTTELNLATPLLNRTKQNKAPPCRCLTHEALRITNAFQFNASPFLCSSELCFAFAVLCFATPLLCFAFLSTTVAFLNSATLNRCLSLQYCSLPLLIRAAPYLICTQHLHCFANPCITKTGPNGTTP